MKTCCLFFFTGFLWAFLLSQTATGQIPRTLSYQGVLADQLGNPRPDGFYPFTFRLYSVPTGGAPTWSETQSLEVKKGLFTAVLGSVTPFPIGLKFNQQYWLGVRVAPDAEMTPRTQITSVGSSFDAMRADLAESVPDSSVTKAKIARGQVVKSLNTLTDDVVLQGANGASVTADGNIITIAASGGGGTGVGALQNTDNTLSITNPSGPTATINAKVPFTITSPTGSYGYIHTDGTVSLGTWVGTGATGSGGWIGTKSNHALNFFTNDAGAGMTLSTAGNLGVGMNNPYYRLDVSGAIRSLYPSSTEIAVQTTGGTNAWARYLISTPAQSWVLGSSRDYIGNIFYLADLTFNQIRMYVYPNSGEIGFQGPMSNHVNISTQGGTNAWAQLRVSTASRTWLMGTSRDYNGNQLYFSDLTANQIRMVIATNGNVGIGTTDPTERLQVAGRTKTQTLEITGGSDFAERFDVSEERAGDLQPGMIVSIDPLQPGRLRASTEAYDHRVAGIISGAGGVNTGMLMGQGGGITDGKQAVALTGRVYCYGDAAFGPIEPGDLLTTSNIRGHAMKAADEARSRGAIIGKAMTGLKAGRGLILILLSLQ
jgi:hypothetical protein